MVKEESYFNEDGQGLTEKVPLHRRTAGVEGCCRYMGKKISGKASATAQILRSGHAVCLMGSKEADFARQGNMRGVEKF